MTYYYMAGGGGMAPRLPTIRYCLCGYFYLLPSHSNVKRLVVIHNVLVHIIHSVFINDSVLICFDRGPPSTSLLNLYNVLIRLCPVSYHILTVDVVLFPAIPKEGWRCIDENSKSVDQDVFGVMFAAQVSQ